MRFTSFLDKKHKEAKRELGIIRDVLSEGDMEVQDFLSYVLGGRIILVD